MKQQFSGTNGEGNNVLLGDFSRELAEADRMMRELRSRNFGKQLKDAEDGKKNAQLCKDVLTFLHPLLSNWFETQCAKYNIESPVTVGRSHHLSTYYC